MDNLYIEQEKQQADESKPNYGRGIRKLRAIMDLSQKELAVRLEMTQQNLSFLEQKEAWPYNLLIKVSDILNIPMASIDYLATEENLMELIIKNDYQKNKGSIEHIINNEAGYNIYDPETNSNTEKILGKLQELTIMLQGTMKASKKGKSNPGDSKPKSSRKAP